MPEPQTCLNDPELQGLVDGSLPEGKLASSAAHLETCRDCRRRLQLLAGESSVIPLGDASTSESAAASDALKEAMRNLKADVDVTAETVASATPGPPVLQFLSPAANPRHLGRLGGYEILEVIGRGGMGTVLKARDTKLERLVAVKVLNPDLAASEEARARFLREAQSAAAVIHEHVVTIHAVDDSGRAPFLVMEYIVGVSLEDRIRRSGYLRLEEILRIGMQAASGLAAAHAQGLVHRDIKPGNILLENGVERVKITDFGLARVIHDAHLAETNEAVGTPQYMSPEQARGGPIDHRSDLFSLGCVFYAMCVGRSPFRADTPIDALRRVREDKPRPIREVNPDVPDWLVAIIDRLLAKNPEDRFQTAGEVAELLGQYLAHVQQPSRIGLPRLTVDLDIRGRNAGYRRRNSLIAAVAGCLALVLIAMLGLAGLWNHNRPEVRHDEVKVPAPATSLAEDELGKVVVDFVPSFFLFTVSGNGGDWRMTESGVAKAKSLPPGPYKVRLTTKSGRLLREGSITVAKGRIAHLLALNSFGLSPLEPQPVPKQEVLGSAGPVWDITFCHRGDRVALGGGEGVVEIRALEAGQGAAPLRLAKHEGPVRQAAFSPDDAVLASAGDDGTIRLWDVASGKLLATMPAHEGGVLAIAFSPDGTRLASGGKDNTVAVWDCHTQSLLGRLTGHQSEVTSIAFSPDGTMLASAGGNDRTVRVWNVETLDQRLVLSGHTESVQKVAFSRDETLLGSVGLDGMVRLWDVSMGRLIRTLDTREGFCYSLAFSPDGKSLAVSTEQTVKRWDITTGEKLNDFHAHWHEVRGVAFSPDGSLLATASLDGSARFWDLTRSQPGFPKKPACAPRATLVCRANTMVPTCSVALPPSGDTIAAGHMLAGWVHVWNMASLDKLAAFDAVESGRSLCLDLKSLAFTPDGKLLVAAVSTEAAVKVYDATTFARRRSFPVSPGIALLAPVRDSSALIISHWSCFQVNRWDLGSGQAVWSCPVPAQAHPTAPTIAPDGSRVAIGTSDGNILLLDPANGKPIHAPLFHGGVGNVFAAFSPDGKTLASASDGKTIKLWDAGTLKLSAALPGNSEVEFVYSLEFSPDSRLLAIAGGANLDSPPPWRSPEQVALWDMAKERFVAKIASHAGWASIALFTPDGKTLVTAGRDARVRLWDVEELLKYGAGEATRGESGPVSVRSDAGKAERL